MALKQKDLVLVTEDNTKKDNLPEKKLSTRQQTKLILRQLYEDINTARTKYRNNPYVDNSLSYQGLIREYRFLLKDFEDAKNMDKLFERIVNDNLNPLVHQLTSCIIRESGSLKENLITKLKPDLVDKLLSTFIKAVGTNFEEILHDNHKMLGVTLGLKNRPFMRKNVK